MNSLQGNVRDASWCWFESCFGQVEQPCGSRVHYGETGPVPSCSCQVGNFSSPNPHSPHAISHHYLSATLRVENDCFKLSTRHPRHLMAAHQFENTADNPMIKQQFSRRCCRLSKSPAKSETRRKCFPTLTQPSTVLLFFGFLDGTATG